MNFKKAAAYFCQKKVSKVRLYETKRYSFSNYLNGSITSCFSFMFYDWLKRGVSKRTIQRNQQTILVKIAHEETKAELWLYSINQILTSSGHKMSMYAVRQIKALNHLYCKRHKRFKRTTNSDHNRAIYENLLEQQFSMTRPNQAWSSDITYIWTVEGWLYLAAVKDLYTKQVVGYSLNERMTAQLVCNALNMAIHNQNQPKN